MLDINFIRNNADKVRQAIRSKRLDQILDLDQLLELDKRKRALTATVDSLRQNRNRIAESVPQLNDPEKSLATEEGKQVSDKLKVLNLELTEIESNFHRLMLLVPGIPHCDVPDGASDDDNLEIRR
jgi:seryl-tRNA synthetase